MPRSRVQLLALLPLALAGPLVGMVAALPACTSNRAAPDPTIDPKWAIPPTAIAVHPLTRVGADSAGNPALLLYLEVHDEFGQSIKALGRIRVELYRPSGVRASGPGTGEASVGGMGGANGADEPTALSGATTGDSVQPRDQAWDIDLTEPNRNARMFDDLVTRTYTFPLGGLPAWLTDWSRATGASGGPAITVAFTFRDADGAERTLRAGYRLSR